jgi:hypothetical protein
VYPWIWRQLPGPVPVRLLVALALVAVIVLACFTWLFPAVAPYMPFNDQTVG